MLRKYCWKNGPDISGGDVAKLFTTSKQTGRTCVSPDPRQKYEDEITAEAQIGDIADSVFYSPHDAVHEQLELNRL
jgi:hypothetical protein